MQHDAPQVGRHDAGRGARSAKPFKGQLASLPPENPAHDGLSVADEVGWAECGVQFHQSSARPAERRLAAQANDHFARHGRPWLAWKPPDRPVQVRNGGRARKRKEFPNAANDRIPWNSRQPEPLLVRVQPAGVRAGFEHLTD